MNFTSSFRTVMSKILELGYPRNPAMRNLVPDVLERIQAQLRYVSRTPGDVTFDHWLQEELNISHAVKETTVHLTEKHALEQLSMAELENCGPSRILRPSYAKQNS